MEWMESGAGLWRSADGGYVIVRMTLPEPRPTDIYLVRAIDPAMRKVKPGTLGYHIDEEYDLERAKASAERHANARQWYRPVPVDYPHDEMTEFFWPISDGTSRAALVIQRDGETVRAQVVGMSCRKRGKPFTPGVYAEVSV